MASPDYARVRELFLAAIELSETEQVELLDQECGQDTDLRQAVQRLIDHHDPETLILDCEQPRSEAEVPEANAASTTPGTVKFGETVAVPGENSHAVLQRKTSAFRLLSRSRLHALRSLIAGVTLLILLGIWVKTALHNSAKDTVQRTMQALLDEQVYAIKTWLAAEERIVRSWTRSPEVLNCVDALNEISKGYENPSQALAESAAAEDLRKLIDRLTPSDGNFSYALWNREGTLIADSEVSHATFLGNGTTEYGASLLSRVFQGETVLWLPSRAGFITRDFKLTGKVTKPGITLIAPVFSGGERPIAAMLIADARMQPTFEELLQKGRFGDTSETYALAEDGYLITESRFLSQLQEIGLVDDEPDAWSTQVVRVADPGGDLLAGYQPDRSRAEWPLTHAANTVLGEISGSNFEGYRDYRGVDVVGAWAWLPRYRFAVVTEVDYEQAFNVLAPLNRAFMVILATLGLATLAVIGSTLALLRTQQNAGAAIQIGPYTLKALIGEGGFARVFLADHALLKRPTAVKILKPELMTKTNLLRFEREVQLASGLTHPNTIGIYDYGSTEDGDFYYAMEYIKGLALSDVVEIDGPQCAERVVWILTQICRSLREAHEKGLVHRDIKPQNIMLCRRGGEHDTVKVLDFGLARDFASVDQKRVTETRLLIGTPLYIAPERIVDATSMDARSDIYSLGILAYFLLTGREPFDAVDSMDALAQTIHRPARLPSQQTRIPIPAKLDQLVHDCHLRAIDERPQSVEAVLDRLEQIKFASPWNHSLARAWWDSQHEALLRSEDSTGKSQVRRTIELALRNKPQNTETDQVG